MIVLTGGSGFLGCALLDVLRYQHVRCVGRQKPPGLSCSLFYQSEINFNADFSPLLLGASVVIHCAARVHIMKDGVSDPLEEYRRVNVVGTLNLARQAAAAGVRRFIFISSVKVNGEQTYPEQPFTDLDVPLPNDDYGLSKWEAEQELMELADETGMEVVTIRPPLVYGPSVKGNFSSISKLIKKEFPLPLSTITKNKRSLIALENLVDFILLCADYNKTPQAANQTFLISDGEDISTAELFKRVAKAYGKKNRLFPFPDVLLRLGAKLLGKQAIADRLLGSLQVDSSKARELIGWKPVVTMEEQLKKMSEADSSKV